MMKIALHFVVCVVLHQAFTFQIPEDANLFEGDILLDPDQRAAIENGHAFASKSGKIWPQTIAYEISSQLKNNKKVNDAIHLAFDHYKKHTCLRFVPRTFQRQYILFTKGACSSHIGPNGGVRKIYLDDRCNKWGVAVHEIMHALGFWHEQSRPDRDQHVKIIWKNIPLDARVNFKKYGRDKIDSLGVEYDLRSIMHYTEDAWTGNRNYKSILTVDPSKQYLLNGTRTSGFSALDIKQIRLLYKCNGTIPITDYPITAPPCQDFYSHCERYKHHCNGQVGSALRKWVEKDCIKTCGLCPQS